MADNTEAQKVFVITRHWDDLEADTENVMVVSGTREYAETLFADLEAERLAEAHNRWSEINPTQEPADFWLRVGEYFYDAEEFVIQQQLTV